MGKIIAKTQIKREQGKLYYCGTDDKGMITVCCSEMARGRKKKQNEKK